MKERNSNFEILRIIAMFLIIAHHFAVHTNWLNGTTFIVKAFQVGGKLGVNLFVLISGYFLVSGKFKLKKLIRLVLEVIFYSVGIYLVMCALGKTEFKFNDLIYYCMPLTNKIYWFATTYVIMYCLAPFINIIIKNVTKKQYICLLIGLVAIQSIIPIITHKSYLGEVGWFITLYLIAGFIRTYDAKVNKWETITTAKTTFMFRVFLNIIAITTFALMVLLNTIWNINVWNMESVVCVMCAISIFILFKGMKPKYSQFVNIISSTTFGVYLIHDNKFRSILWNEWIQPYRFVNEWWFVFYAITIVFTIFVACMTIDLCRQVIEKGVKGRKIGKL